MNRGTGPSKSASKLPKVGKALLVAVAVVATTLGAAACGPSSHPHPKKSSLGPAGY